jgi:hypothetical protein
MSDSVQFQKRCNLISGLSHNTTCAKSAQEMRKKCAKNEQELRNLLLQTVDYQQQCAQK